MGWQSVVCSLSFHGWCPQPAPLFDYPFGHLYFFMLTFADIFVLLLMLSVVGGFFMRLRSPAWWLSRMWADPSSAGTPFAATQRDALGNTPLTVLLPCYLPNEQTLLDTTISHLLEKLEYSYPFQLIICYNTPHPLEYEAKLATRDGTTHASGRTIRVLKVEGSTSKAQNLNAALELVETEQLVIYDADHHPDPHSLLIASAHMQSKGCSCVQGSTYLRERPSLLSAYINAEFFVTHFVFFPAMEFISSLGVFGGSNALWKTEALKSYEFRHDVQTEDIELSTRAMLGGRVTISFCPECRSGELPPATFTALYKQRLRWALGWDQVTLQHMGSIWQSNTTWWQKLGLYYILPARWALLFSATLNALITPLVAWIWSMKAPGAELGVPIDTCLTISFYGFVLCGVVNMLNIIIHEPVKLWPAVVVFQGSGMLYVGWQLLLVIVSLTNIFSGTDVHWEVTKRISGSASGAAPVTSSSSSPHVPSAGGADPGLLNSARVTGRVATVSTRHGCSPTLPTTPLAAAFNPITSSLTLPAALGDEAHASSGAGASAAAKASGSRSWWGKSVGGGSML